jgi:hypothetical protein
MQTFNQKNWTMPHLLQNTAPEISAFEQIVRELRLTPAEYQNSAPLKEWVRKNKDQKYVPLDLLKAWGFKVRAEI